MTDHISTDLASAAHLAAEDGEPDERPTLDECNLGDAPARDVPVTLDDWGPSVPPSTPYPF